MDAHNLSLSIIITSSLFAFVAGDSTDSKYIQTELYSDCISSEEIKMTHLLGRFLRIIHHIWKQFIIH